jgi:hypothetical protein
VVVPSAYDPGLAPDGMTGNLPWKMVVVRELIVARKMVSPCLVVQVVQSSLRLSWWLPSSQQQHHQPSPMQPPRNQLHFCYQYV